MTTNTSIAATRPRRVRHWRVIGTMSSIIIAIAAKTICRMATGGVAVGVFVGASIDALVTVTVTLLPGAPEAGLTEQDAIVDDALAHATPTLPVNPPSPLIATDREVLPPLRRLALAGTVRLKSHAVPDTAIDCGLPLALSVSEIVPEVGPGAVVDEGANVTVIVQVAPAAMDPSVQLSLSVKLLELEAMAVIVSGEFPVFVTVTG